MKPSIKKTERNQALYKDYLSKKYSTAELAVKYDISTTRVYYLVKRIREKGEK